MNSLRQKFSLIYFCLVIMIAIVGAVSVYNLYGLTKTIDGLMTDNYESLKIINNMIESFERQDSAILTYTSGNRQQGLEDFNSNIDNFLMWYYKEQNNITEIGEKNLVLQLKQHYMDYLNAFDQLTNMADNKNQNQLMQSYDTTIHPIFLLIKDDLQALWDINEAAMFRGKSQTTDNARSSTHSILFVSSIAVIGGFFISRFFANKFTRPVEQLTTSMKEVQTGNLTAHIEAISDDEIGQLSIEFNRMTERLLTFEQSTLGKIMMEKNKSLAIVKSISDPLMVLDNDYKIILINTTFEKFFEAEEDDALKRHFLEIVRVDELYDYIASVMSGDNVYHKENIFYLESGEEYYYFNVIVTKIQDTEAKMNGVVVLFQNVTELKELERMKTNFISTISHEFKTPLTSIMMGTSLLTDCTMGDVNSSQQEVLNSMEEDCERLSNLVDNLLYLSKLESTKYIYTMAPTKFETIIENTIKPYYFQSESKGVHLHYDTQQNLPLVHVDSERITWVLNNLMVNAFKYTKAGDQISIQVHTQDHAVYISVKDTGLGIPKEYLNKIFEPFVQVENADLEIRGTGLGLSIAKEIVTAHGGEIWCESTLDQGSCFTFTIPAIK